MVKRKQQEIASDSGSDLGSDFGECVEEYSVDSDGNPKNAPPIDGMEDQQGEEKETKSLEDRRKDKRLAKLDKRIKATMKRHEKEKNVKMAQPSQIRNKQKRQEIALMKKMAERRESKIEKLKKKKIREEHGEEAMPKGVTQTIESMRVKDETIITDADDDELLGE